jgi:hypothetical protein
MQHSAVSLLPYSLQQAPNLPLAEPQPRARFPLFQMPRLHFVPYPQPISLSLSQLDPLLFRQAPRPLEKRTSTLHNRTLSLCSERRIFFT